MKPLDIDVLNQDGTFPWFVICQIDATFDRIIAWTQSTPTHGPNEGLGESDTWALECDCGLILVIEWHAIVQNGIVYASEPSERHARRHMEAIKDCLRSIPENVLAYQNSQRLTYYLPANPGLRGLEGYQLWRQGDDGNPIQVGEPTSFLDAQCWANQMESLKHKQLYWVSKVEEPKRQ